MNDEKFARVCAIFDDLIGFPTVSARTNLDLIEYCRARLSARGIASVPVFNEDRTKANLVAAIGPKEARGGLLFSGHTDVVPVEGQHWTSDPFRLVERDGKFFGRGTCDMKGFIACVLAEAESLDASRLSKPFQMIFSFDEEIGCVGVRRVIDDFASYAMTPDCVIVGEPTMMRPAIGHKGKVAGIIRCHGHACHSSHAPDGLNAIHLATDMVQHLRHLQKEHIANAPQDEGFTIPFTTLHAGVIHGGTALNIVPADCDVEFEIRNIPSDNPDQLLDRLFDKAKTLTDEARQRFPECGVTIDIVNRYPGLLRTENASTMKLIEDHCGVTATQKIAFGTEGGLFQEKIGCPVYVCGPGDIAQAHKADEFVSRAQLGACINFIEIVSAGLYA